MRKWRSMRRSGFTKELIFGEAPHTRLKILNSSRRTVSKILYNVWILYTILIYLISNILSSNPTIYFCSTPGRLVVFQIVANAVHYQNQLLRKTGELSSDDKICSRTGSVVDRGWVF